jgi:hypothetical protein
MASIIQRVKNIFKKKETPKPTPESERGSSAQQFQKSLDERSTITTSSGSKVSLNVPASTTSGGGGSSSPTNIKTGLDAGGRPISISSSGGGGGSSSPTNIKTGLDAGGRPISISSKNDFDQPKTDQAKTLQPSSEKSKQSTTHLLSSKERIKQAYQSAPAYPISVRGGIRAGLEASEIATEKLGLAKKIEGTFLDRKIETSTFENLVLSAGLFSIAPSTTTVSRELFEVGKVNLVGATTRFKGGKAVTEGLFKSERTGRSITGLVKSETRVLGTSPSGTKLVATTTRGTQIEKRIVFPTGKVSIKSTKPFRSGELGKVTQFKDSFLYKGGGIVKSKSPDIVYRTESIGKQVKVGKQDFFASIGGSVTKQQQQIFSRSLVKIKSSSKPSFDVTSIGTKGPSASLKQITKSQENILKSISKQSTLSSVKTTAIIKPQTPISVIKPPTLTGLVSVQKPTTIQSSFYGTGQYELTQSSGMIPLSSQPTLITNFESIGQKQGPTQILIQPQRESTRIKLRGGIGTGQSTPQIQTPTTITKTTPTLTTPTRTITPQRLKPSTGIPTTITPRFPTSTTPFILPPLPFGADRGMRMKRIPASRTYKYTPSFKAIVFGIRGKGKTPEATKRFTGLELRPIYNGGKKKVVKRKVRQIKFPNPYSFFNRKKKRKIKI